MNIKELKAAIRAGVVLQNDNILVTIGFARINKAGQETASFSAKVYRNCDGWIELASSGNVRLPVGVFHDIGRHEGAEKALMTLGYEIEFVGYHSSKFSVYRIKNL